MRHFLLEGFVLHWEEFLVTEIGWHFLLLCIIESNRCIRHMFVPVSKSMASTRSLLSR